MILPYNYIPRPYQLPLLQAMDRGYKRAVQVWHRRSGKDKTDWNYMIKEAVRIKAQYFYFFPTYSQGKKVIWDGIDSEGFRFIDHIPSDIRTKRNDTEMKVELVNGSLIQIIGTDNIDSIVGTNPRGCIFSEYSLQDPKAWQFIRPILAANDGWAIFNFTPRGNNHAKQLLDLAEKNPDQWYVSRLTVDDTNSISEEVLAREKTEMQTQTGNNALFLQEYYCSFDAPVEGAYYASQLLTAQSENRITTIPVEMDFQVNTYWDLGVGDSTAIWFEQTIGNEIRLIDYYETHGEGLTHYIKVLQQKGYIYGRHFAPHDIDVRELSSGKSRKEIAKSLGITFDIAPKLPIDDGINAARTIFNRLWFDKERCARGIDALKNYTKEWDEPNKIYKNKPEHNWASHGSDAFRYFAVSYSKEEIVEGDIPNDMETYSGFY